MGFGSTASAAGSSDMGAGTFSTAVGDFVGLVLDFFVTTTSGTGAFEVSASGAVAVASDMVMAVCVSAAGRETMIVYTSAEDESIARATRTEIQGRAGARVRCAIDVRPRRARFPARTPWRPVHEA